MIWVIAVALSTAAGLAIAWRSLADAHHDQTARSRHGYDVEVYRDQLQELERDLDRGIIDPDDAEAARNEIRRRVLAATDAQKETEDALQSRYGLSRSTVMLLAFAVPILSLALYALTGRPKLSNPANLTVQEPRRDPTAADLRAAERMTPEQRHEMIRGMVDQLAARLRENPGDLAGWLRLGRAYSVMGEHQKATEAYARAAALAPKNVRVLTAYTMSVIRSQNQGESMAPGAVALVKRLYELEPQHPLALYYLGKNAFDLGQEAAGRKYWGRLLPLLKDRPDFADRIRKRLDRSGQ
ncbi:MAG: c-type cytochrome biogenesis protein CcmI [Rhodospirillaceae bacterium]|nr:c-type cytochrome biogenesis protein CcmI [Rhodospirillaceae bacterium]